MSYDARVYRILIASPSDVEEERDTAVSVIQAWNDLYSAVRKIVLLPVRWETHTAPQYNSRPQEVINRAIVDDCDLLVGIFWTRIGSPTGVAESGTLEEIERVGNADKPVMIYFSKVEIDPERIDLDQINKLRTFKLHTYPNGLIENYKRLTEFREKFTRQLEMKLRDLQKSESLNTLPLHLNLMSLKDGEPIGLSQKVDIIDYNILNMDKLKDGDREKLAPHIAAKKDLFATAPIVIGVSNKGSSSIINPYFELEFSSDNDEMQLSESAPTGVKGLWNYNFITHIMESHSEDYPYKDIEDTFARYESEKFIKTGRNWKYSFSWEVIQPTRLRLIRPFVFLKSSMSGIVSIHTKVYSDISSDPAEFNAKIHVNVEKCDAKFDDFIPNWKSIVARDAESKPLRLHVGGMSGKSRPKS